jgi:hypothetical protein
MVIAKLDISNECGSLYVSLVLDVLSGKTSLNYDCVIKVEMILKQWSMN